MRAVNLKRTRKLFGGEGRSEAVWLAEYAEHCSADQRAAKIAHKVQTATVHLPEALKKAPPKQKEPVKALVHRAAPAAATFTSSALITMREPRKVPKPTWHAPWKLMRVIAGHAGWVRSISVDASNEWFATGAGDRIIKIW